MKRPELSFLLLTWNRAPMLERCLRSFFERISGEVAYELIIMDNASTDRTAEILARYEGREHVRIVRNRENLRLNAYKKLFRLGRGRLLVELDDDVIALPRHFDKTFVRYFKEFPDYGYIGLNVVVDEKTWGAKAPQDQYCEDVRGELVIEEGPVGGWCTAFRRRHYLLFAPFLRLFNFTMARCEDGTLCGFLHVILRKRQGLIKNERCLHATGPYYAKEMGLMDREIDKYENGGQPEVAARYRAYDAD